MSSSTQAFSSWQVLLVDLRCHGNSAHIQMAFQSNSVESAAADVLELLRHLKLFPEILIGHSFGGKVVMSMADQFGRIGPRLPRPVQVSVQHLIPSLPTHKSPTYVSYTALSRDSFSIRIRICCETQVWVLDTQPGEVVKSTRPGARRQRDHPQDLIAQLQVSVPQGSFNL